MKRFLKYIKQFMGTDFRSTEGVGASFEFFDFKKPHFACILFHVRQKYSILRALFCH